MRKALSLDTNWFERRKTSEDAYRFIRQAISNIGVIVIMSGFVGSNTHRALKVEEFRAFALTDDYAPLIFINAADAKSGMLFSILHELTHIGLGTCSLFNADIGVSKFVDPHESICNAVTAEILAPKPFFVQKWNEFEGDLDEKLKSAEAYFKCSRFVIVRRALDSSFITPSELSMLIKTGKGKTTGYKTQASRFDTNFLLALIASIQEGKTLHTQAFRLTNTNRSTFDRLIQEVQSERK